MRSLYQDIGAVMAEVGATMFDQPRRFGESSDVGADDLTYRSIDDFSQEGQVYVSHLGEVALRGYPLVSLINKAAPFPDRIIGRSLRNMVFLFGAGVFGAENTPTLEAYRDVLANGIVWGRTFVASQQIRHCLDPYSVYGKIAKPDLMQSKYGWSQSEEGDVKPPRNQEELLETIENLNREAVTGISPVGQYEARVLRSVYGSFYPREYVELRSPDADTPISILVPNSNCHIDLQRVQPPEIAPILAWKVEGDRRVPLAAWQAGELTERITTDDSDYIRYRSSTLGLIIAAVRLGVNTGWPKVAGIGGKEIKMEAPQVPLLAESGADEIINHPKFDSLFAS